MASFTLTAAQIFPNGTSVGAYPVTNWARPRDFSGAPLGSATDTQTMTSSTLTFTGLTAATDYQAVADLGGGNYRYVRFTAAADAAASSSGATDAEVSAAVATKADTSSLAAADASTLEVVGGVLREKDGGTTLAKLATAAKADWEYAYSDYKRIGPLAASRLDAPGAGTFVLLANAGVLAANASAGYSVFYLDPANYAAGSRTVKYNLDATALVNATAPTVNFTLGLYPVTAVAGAAATLSITLGTVTSGSTCLFTAPGATSTNHVNSTDFTAPAAGYFAIGCVVSGAAAANSSTLVGATLQMRQV